MIFSVLKKIRFLGILGPPYCGNGATIRIGREMLYLPYARFFLFHFLNGINVPLCPPVSPVQPFFNHLQQFPGISQRFQEFKEFFKDTL